MKSNSQAMWQSSGKIWPSTANSMRAKSTITSEQRMLATIAPSSTLNQEAYDAWLTAEVQAAIDDPRPSIPHGEVTQRMYARLAALEAAQAEKIHV
jgi:hypothetical protein